MLRNCWRVFGAGASVVALLSLSACSTPTEFSGLWQLSKLSSVEAAKTQATQALTPKVSNGALVESGVLTVGLPVQYAPMAFKSDGGELSGFDLDVAYLLGDALGLPVKFVPGAQTKDLGNTCDVLMDQHKSNNAQLSFHDGYATDALSVFARSDTKLTQATDLVDAVVGVQAGSESQERLKELNLGTADRTYANLEDAFYALEAGEVSYVVSDALCGAYTASNLDNITLVGVLSESEPLGIANLASNTELDQALAQAMDSLKSGSRLGLLKSFWLGSSSDASSQLMVSGIQDAQAKVRQRQEAQSTSSADDKNTDGENSSTSSTNSSSNEGGSTSSSTSRQGSTTGSASDKKDGSNAGANAVVITEGS